jgi:hypothetical protein
MWNRREKDKIRKKIFTNIQELGIIKKYLCLPGEDVLCIKTGKSLGVFTTDTHILAYENNTSIFQKIKNNNILTDFNKLSLHHQDITESQHKNIDFAFLDFCGTLGVKEAMWLQELLNNGISRNGSVAITMLWGPQTPPQLYKLAQKFFKNNNTYEQHILSSFKNSIGMPIDKDINKFIPCFILCCVLQNHTFDTAYVYRYKDLGKRTMQVIQLIGIKKSQKNNNFPSLEKILQQGGEKQKMKKANVDWSEAGRKSWETRRLNMKKKKRSDAAKRAWVTIRKNNGG